MNRQQEMDNFLKYYASLYAQNPNFPIYADTFYEGLMNYGLTNEEALNPDMKANFEKWIQRYQKSNQMLVYHDLRQKRFLQFHSRKHSDTFGYKLYLSFPQEIMEECVNEVMDFVERNKMDTYSKVSDRVRSDSVVLRLANPTDAAKIMDFVNRNPRLTRAAKPTNPFVMRFGVMGFAYYDLLSYNSTVTMLLESYFTEKRQNNALGTVSQADFAQYARGYHSSLFSDPQKLDAFTKRRDFNNRHQSLGHAIANYEQVLRLAAASASGDFSFEQYKRFVETSTNKQYTDEYARYYGEFVQAAHPQFQEHGYKTTPQMEMQKQEQSVDLGTKQALLDQYIEVALQKYGPKGMMPYIERYMNGYPEAITRDGGLRFKFMDAKISRTDIMSICGGNLEAYISKFQNQQNLAASNFDLVYKSFVATFRKYGYAQLYGAIERGAMGNFGAFTNGPERLRDQLCSSVTPEEFIRICNEIARRHGFNPEAVPNGYLYAADAIQIQLNNTQQVVDVNYKKM